MPEPQVTPAPPAPAPAPTPAPSPAPAAPAPEQPPRFDVAPEVEAIFGYDPFSDGKSASAPAEPSAPPAKQVQDSPPAPTPAPAPSSPPVEPEAALLRRQLEEAQQTIRTLSTAQTQAPPQQQPQQTAEDVDADLPAYTFQVPDKLLDLIGSENREESRAGVSALLQGAGRAIHKTVVDSIRREVSVVVPRLIQNGIAVHAMQRAVFDDFYGKYPELNVPAIRPIVQQVGMSVARELGVTRWTPELRDAVGQRIKTMLSTVQPNGQAGPVQAVPAPVMAPVATRPAPAAVPSEQAQMADMLRY